MNGNAESFVNKYPRVTVNTYNNIKVIISNIEVNVLQIKS